MYSTLGNQAINITRYGLSFLIVFVLWSQVLYGGRPGGDILEGFMARYIRMVGLIIATGYLLVVFRLYELASLITVLILVAIYQKHVWSGKPHSPLETFAQGLLWLYNCLDGLINPVRLATGWLRRGRGSFGNFVSSGFSGITTAGNTLLFVSVLAYSAYLRVYDAVVHAAPPMSDSYVTLVWMKYIEKKFLFHDGIYPQGLHIYLSVLHKFAAIDPLYVLKYSGSLNSALTILGIYFVVSRLTGRQMAGIMSAFALGVLVNLIHLEWARQVAANSQEFALVFLFPAMYYADRYLRSGQRSDFWVAATAFTIIGWVHSMIFMFLGVGLFCLLAAHLLFNFREALRPVWHVCLAGAGAAVLSGLPAVLGLVMGKSFHGSSVGFLLAATEVPYPAITLMDKIALGGLLLFFVGCVCRDRSRKGLATAFFVLILGAASFGMYLILGPLTGKVVLVARLSLLWGMMTAVALGVGWSGLFKVLPGKKVTQLVELVLGVAIIAYALVYFKPVPAEPYKMEYDSAVQQYLRISNDFRPTEWTIVSNEEGYDLSLGRGFHIMLGDFLKQFNPADKRLTTEDGSILPDLFLFKEKRQFPMDSSIQKDMEPILQRRATEYGMLDQWLDTYRATHDNLNVYYEDADIQVFHISQSRTREEVFREIWGIGTSNEKTPQ